MRRNTEKNIESKKFIFDAYAVWYSSHQSVEMEKNLSFSLFRWLAADDGPAYIRVCMRQKLLIIQW